MKSRSARVLCGLACVTAALLFLAWAGAFSGTAEAQPQAEGNKAARDFSDVPVDRTSAPVGTAEVKPPERTIDQLVTQLKDVRAQRVLLEKREKEITAALKEKIKELEKLGLLDPPPSPAPQPPAAPLPPPAIGGIAPGAPPPGLPPPPPPGSIRAR